MENPAARVAMDKGWDKWRMEHNYLCVDMLITAINNTCCWSGTTQNDTDYTIQVQESHSLHTSASVFLTLNTLSIHGHRDLILHPRAV